MTDSNYDKIEKLAAWAQEREHTLSELAEVWLLAQPAVCSVISGATKLEQIQANVKAADWKLSAEEIQIVSGMLVN
jgi:aryl-alcohol dehydrogenase-like predicted oxidoreductase